MVRSVCQFRHSPIFVLSRGGGICTRTGPLEGTHRIFSPERLLFRHSPASRNSYQTVEWSSRHFHSASWVFLAGFLIRTFPRINGIGSLRASRLQYCPRIPHCTRNSESGTVKNSSLVAITR